MKEFKASLFYPSFTSPTVRLLNKLTTDGRISIVIAIVVVGYLIRRGLFVKVRYINDANVFSVCSRRDGLFFCPGPGWAYTRRYLRKLLFFGFNFFYSPKPGDNVIDLGAGLGEESYEYSKLVGSEGNVISVEANPRIYSLLNQVKLENKLVNVTCLNLAIAGANAPTLIEDNPSSYLGNSLCEISREATEPIEVCDRAGRGDFCVEGVTLERLLDLIKLDRIDFLKVNIEGAESFLAKCPIDRFRVIENLCISCHDFRYHNGEGNEFFLTRDIIIEFLYKAGYQILKREPINNLLDNYIYASRTSLMQPAQLG